MASFLRNRLCVFSLLLFFSNVYGARDTPSPTSHQIFANDQSRVDSLNNPDADPSLAVADSILGAGNYLVTVGFGTPPQEATLIMDTGSDLTWIQCKPCPSGCYPQQEPMFDPSASSTYTSTSCSTPSCSYSYTYHDQSFTAGQYANDTLTLPDGNGTFPHFIFGCGHNNSPDFGNSAGVLGLSKLSARSFLSQTQSAFAQIFCYCRRQGSSGYLLFGFDALRKCQTESFTPTLTHPTNNQLYFVDLVGITIGGKRLVVSALGLENPQHDHRLRHRHYSLAVLCLLGSERGVQESDVGVPAGSCAVVDGHVLRSERARERGDTGDDAAF